MYTSKLGTMIAILAAAAGFAALAGTAKAQIPGSTGGDVVAQHSVPGFDDPFFFPRRRLRGGSVGPEMIAA